MKALKSTAIAIAIGAAALLCVGASSGGDKRPSDIAAENWVSLSGKVGLAISPSVNTASSVVAQLYIRTDAGWQRARIENPA